MENYFLIRMEVDAEELEKIFKEMDEAKEKIYECYSKLKELGVISFTRANGDAPVKDGLQ